MLFNCASRQYVLFPSPFYHPTKAQAFSPGSNSNWSGLHFPWNLSSLIKEDKNKTFEDITTQSLQPPQMRRVLLRGTSRKHCPPAHPWGKVSHWRICLPLWFPWHLWPMRKGLPNPNLIGQNPAWTSLQSCLRPGSPPWPLTPVSSCKLIPMGPTGLHGLKEGNHPCGQQSLLGSDRPADSQLYKHIFWNPPNSSYHG